MNVESWKILVVDDSSEARAEVRRLLLEGSDRRYQFLEAATAAESMPLWDTVDCVVLDYHLPDMQAPAALVASRSDRPLTSTPVVVLMGTPGRDHSSAVLRAGAMDYLGKDWMNAESLTRAVENAVERHALQRELLEREARVKVAEEQSRLLLESTGEAIYRVDTQGKCTFCNPACVRMLGYGSDAALLNQDMHELIHHTRADGSPYPVEECRIYQAFRCGENIHTAEESLWRADGTSFPAELWSQPIRRDGQIVGAVVTFIDITDRKRYEQQLLDANQHKDDFIALLAHELRNPLAPIRNATQVFELLDLDDDMLNEMCEVIKRQVDQMARLLDDLLDVSRIARGKISLKREPTDLCRLVRTTAEDLRGTFEEQRIELFIDVPDQVLLAEVDPIRIAQCVGNILHNALKFTDEAGRVDLGLTKQGQLAVIAIRDSGVGMEPDFIEHLFEPFRQADRSLHRSPGGLGLGLAMVRGVVQLHGGQVSASSEGLGKGSELIIRLPLTAK